MLAQMLADFFVFPALLVFFRVSSCIMVMPGVSDISVNVRARLFLAVFVTAAMFPVLSDSMPSLPQASSTMLRYVLAEFVMGILMGIGARIFIVALQIAGEMISFMTGLQASTLFDPSMGGNTTAPSLFLTMTGLILIFAINLHHTIFIGLIESYQYFPAGQIPLWGDTAQGITRVVADMFLVGVKMSAPVVTVGFLVYVGFGIFNRMVSQIQIFFVALPLNIMIGLFFLWVTLGSMLLLFAHELTEHALLISIEEQTK